MDHVKKKKKKPWAGTLTIIYLEKNESFHDDQNTLISLIISLIQKLYLRTGCPLNPGTPESDII